MHTCLEKLKGKKICLVGNSCSLLNKSLGSIIDGYDIVIRFNVWSTAGQEIDVGMRTSVWAISTSLVGRWDGWLDHLGRVMPALEKEWAAHDGFFDYTKIQEFWFVPNVVNPTSLMDLTHSHIPKEIVCKTCHHGPYIRYTHDNRPDKYSMLTCGMRVLCLLLAHIGEVDEIALAGFGSRDPQKRKDEIVHYFHETFEKPMEAVTDAYAERCGDDKWFKVHDINYEHSVINNWIDQGLIRRLEDESDYTV